MLLLVIRCFQMVRPYLENIAFITKTLADCMRELLNGEKLTKMDVLKAEWQTLTAAKKTEYTEYRTAQKDMREVIAVKANIDHLLGITGREKNKEQER